MAALYYTTVDRMLDAFPRIGEVSAITSAQLCTYAADAEALVNAHVSQAYTVPVSGTPPLLATLATDLAVYRTLALRIFTSERMNESVWPDRYKESSALLEKIAEGKIPLVNTSGSIIAESGGNKGEIWSSTSGYLPTFAEIDWRDQLVDPDKVNDELADRGL